MTRAVKELAQLQEQRSEKQGILRRATSRVEAEVSVKQNSFEGKYRWWINPSEPAYVRWTLCLFVFNVVWVHVILPVRLSLFQTSVTVPLASQIIDLLCDTANIADSLTQFYIPLVETGGNSHHSGYIFERKIVALNYLRSWFLLDTVSNVPFSFVYRAFMTNPKLYLVLMSFKLTRVRKAHQGIKRLVRKLGFGVVTIRFAVTLWNIFMMLHLVACLWGCIGEINLQLADTPTNWLTAAGLQDVRNPMEKYLNNLYWATVTITTVGYGDLLPTNNDELVVAQLVMVFAICLFTYNLSSLAQQFAEIIKSNIMRGEQHQWAIEYLYHIPNLDERLIGQIEQYINANVIQQEAELFHQKISLAKQGEEVREVLTLLTPSLKGQLTLFLYKDAIHRIPFLQGRDPKFYLQYLDKMEPLKFHKETVMIKRGTVAQRMYFIVKGKVLNTALNRVYSDGAVIGETELVFKAKRRDNFVAVDEIVHVLKVDARVLKQAMDEFPDIRRDMQELARRRAMAGVSSDQSFQLQLFDFKEQMEVVIESLKKNAVEPVPEEEVEEDTVTLLREEVKLPEPADRERRNVVIDFEQLGRRNNTVEERDRDALVVQEEAKREKKVGLLFKEQLSQALSSEAQIPILVEEPSSVPTEQPEPAGSATARGQASLKTPRLETSPRIEETKHLESRNSLSVLKQANYGRDSNVYKSLEQRLVRNQQLMEQLIFHTKRSKLSLIQHQQRFQDYLDALAASPHQHLVNEEIIETTQ